MWARAMAAAYQISEPRLSEFCPGPTFPRSSVIEAVCRLEHAQRTTAGTIFAGHHRHWWLCLARTNTCMDKLANVDATRPVVIVVGIRRVELGAGQQLAGGRVNLEQVVIAVDQVDHVLDRIVGITV